MSENDIVERLRSMHASSSVAYQMETTQEAAAEILRLREALDLIAAWVVATEPDVVKLQNIAAAIRARGKS